MSENTKSIPLDVLAAVLGTPESRRAGFTKVRYRALPKNANRLALC